MKIRIEFEFDHIREIAPALRSVLVDELIAVPTSYEEAGQGVIEGRDSTGPVDGPSTEIEILRFTPEIEEPIKWAMPIPGSETLVTFRPGFTYSITEVHTP